MLSFIALGTVLGLSAGFAPGPLLTLVISETLQHDVKSGIKVALAPIITDLPIIAATLYLAKQLSSFDNILGIISLIGGSVILYMGYTALINRGVKLNLDQAPPKSLSKGMLVNVLSPHPYLFWLTVGATIISNAMEISITTVAVFLCSFYLLLVGSKIVMAILVGKSKTFLSGNGYIYIMRSLGVALSVFALIMFYDGLKLLQLIQ